MQYVTSVQERQLLACRKLMEGPSNRDIRTDREVTVEQLSRVREASLVAIPDAQVRTRVIGWLEEHGYKVMAAGTMIVFEEESPGGVEEVWPCAS